MAKKGLDAYVRGYGKELMAAMVEAAKKMSVHHIVSVRTLGQV